MKRSYGLKATLVCAASLCGVASLIAVLASCDGGGALPPFLVQGPGGSENEPPTLRIIEPANSFTLGQGDRFVIRWADTDRDSNATISFDLVNTATNQSVLLVAGLAENDTVGPDLFSATTSLIAVGTYNVRGTIEDGVNAAVQVYAMTPAATSQRVEIDIGAPGAVPPTVPPIVAVTEPSFNLSVAEDDILTVQVQPSEAVPDQAVPFDRDSTATLYVLLDLDTDPNNDDPANPQRDTQGNVTRTDIIVLDQRTVDQDAFDTIPFDIQIDLDEVPPRDDGQPYYIRATIDDLTNPRVHKYADGTISVVELAAGTIDLYDIGRRKSGAKFYGFSPGANVGSSLSGVSDFDQDGVADFVLVGQFGNPRNFGRIGEAYLIYGQNLVRFGGSIAVNSVGEAVAGVIFEGPPIRTENNAIPDSSAWTDGISSVGWVPDLTADGRPEILIGMAHVHGAFEAMDFDPGDSNVADLTSTEEVEIVIRQGRVEVGGDATNLSYSGVDDLTISSTTPAVPNGSGDLNWESDGDSDRTWTLIKFKDVLEEIPNNIGTIDITSVRGSLELRVFDTGGPADVRQVFTDFNEQTAYTTFAENGGDPEEGVDYAAGSDPGDFGNLTADNAETVTVDVSDLIRELIDRNLGGVDDELRFIFVPDEDEGERARARSSEYSSRAEDRPTLRITYNNEEVQGAFNCYPDDLANNYTDSTAPDLDWQWYAGGMVTVVHSSNRDRYNVNGILSDANPLGVDPNRLDETAISLELVGQEPGVNLDENGTNALAPSIFVRADNVRATEKGSDPEENNRIAGARFVAGWYDHVDGRLLFQPARHGLWGTDVGSMGDTNNDGLPEVLISAPRNERYLQNLRDQYGVQSTHLASTGFFGSIAVIPGANFNTTEYRELASSGAGSDANSSIPVLDQYRWAPFGTCTSPQVARESPLTPQDSFEVFAEDIDDYLGGAQSAGDFNQDGLDDILCGAPRNNGPWGSDAGAVYVLYGRNVLGDYNLTNADDSLLRTPMLRIRGVHPGDQIGWRQATGLDVNGDRIDDVFISSPWADAGGISRSTCAGDYNGDGNISDADFNLGVFRGCQDQYGDEIFTDDYPCKYYDFDNDGDIDGDSEGVVFKDDEEVFNCFAAGGTDCCGNMVDNGFVGVIFGGVFLDGDRTIEQIATSDLPGAIFYGAAAGHHAGFDISSAGDFNQDGFGDLLIAAPGQTWVDDSLRERLGVVYVIFGGTHLINTTWNLAQVGSADLPGLILYSPYVKGRPNEAAPTTVGYLGDINNDGFGDIIVGNPLADFIDLTFPQGPNAPGSDPAAGRRSNAGDAYVIYGNNFGSNRSIP